MLMRALIYGALFIALLFSGLHLAPLMVSKSGVIAPEGSIFMIHIGNWETVPFAITEASIVTGAFTASLPIQFSVMNSSQFSSLQRGGPLVELESEYTARNVTYLAFEVTLTPGDYFLVFSLANEAWCGPTWCGPVSVRVTSNIIALSTTTQ